MEKITDIVKRVHNCLFLLTLLFGIGGSVGYTTVVVRDNIVHNTYCTTKTPERPIDDWIEITDTSAPFCIKSKWKSTPYLHHYHRWGDIDYIEPWYFTLVVSLGMFIPLSIFLFITWLLTGKIYRWSFTL